MHEIKMKNAAVSFNGQDLGLASEVVVGIDPAIGPDLSVENLSFGGQLIGEVHYIPRLERKVEAILGTDAVESTRTLPTRSVLRMDINGTFTDYIIYRRDYKRGKLWMREAAA